MVSNAADKSNNTNNVPLPLSILNMTSLYTLNNAVSVSVVGLIDSNVHDQIKKGRETT